MYVEMSVSVSVKMKGESGGVGGKMSLEIGVGTRLDGVGGR